MKKVTIALLLTLVLALSTIGGARAVTDGELDGNRHPYVGLMVAQDAKGNPLWRCSGTLLNSTLFLTAGHCTEAPAAHVEIWFASDVESGIPANGYPNKGDVGGTPHTHPQYNPNAFYLFDLGVVVLVPVAGQLMLPRLAVAQVVGHVQVVVVVDGGLVAVLLHGGAPPLVVRRRSGADARGRS